MKLAQILLIFYTLIFPGSEVIFGMEASNTNNKRFQWEKTYILCQPTRHYKTIIAC